MQTTKNIEHYVTLVSCLLILIAGFFVYGATGHDDAHINFWTAWTLLEHGEILNYNGERVEQTTSLLQDIFTVIYHCIFRLDLVTAGFLVDISASAACCYLLVKLAPTTCKNMAAWPALLLLSCTSFLLWTYGGMGATLAAFTVLAAAAIWSRWINAQHNSSIQVAQLVVITLALTLVRPEMPLIAIAVTLCITVFYRSDAAKRYRSLQLLLISLLAAAALFGWQKLYFDSWLPLPVVAKQSGAMLGKFRNGYWYWLFNSVMNPVAFFALLATPWLWWRHSHSMPEKSSPQTLLALLAIFVIVYTGFIWTAGGDWMQAGRFLVPILPAAAMLLTAAANQIQRQWFAHTLLAILCLFQFSVQYGAVATMSKGIPVWAEYRMAQQHQHYSIFEKLNQEHLRDMAAIDHLAEIIPPLREKLQRPVVLMSGQAGMIFYYTAQRFGNNVIFRDLRGLVEGNLTTCPTIKTIPRGQQGLFWGYKDFFALLPQLQTDCGVVAPDIIYDLNDMSRKTGQELETLGYTLLHQENGFPVENKTSLPYNRLYAPNLIFVRSEFLPLLGNPPMRVIDYRNLPLQTRWPMTSTNATHE
ncbi:MAG TPA: hypothetical protein VLB90_02245 [Pseudomonadales bacterium]|nr:hypothetical protein [Pseudomonadales bacterium]